MAEPSYKTILIGDYGVGKSHLRYRLVYNTFGTIYKPTIPHHFNLQTFNIDDKKIKLQIWDTATEERYHYLPHFYWRDAVGAILVYDITKRKSFEGLRVWLEEARMNCLEEISIILVGNKADMENERVISYDEGENFAEENGLVFLEVSCKNGEDVKEAYEKMAELILQKVEAGVICKDDKKTDVKVQKENMASNNQNCAC